MKPAARITDMHMCPMVTPGTPPVPHVGGPISMGAPTVIIGMMPAARIGDMAICVGPPDVIAMGSPTVLIEMKPAARLGDMTAHGGVISVGCPTVLIGEAGGGAGAPKPKSVFARMIKRVRQVFGHNIGIDESQKILESAFHPRKFSKTKITIQDKVAFEKEHDKKYGAGSYAADGPLEGYFDPNTGETFVNKDLASVDTVPHEMLHKNSDPAVGNQMGSNLDEGMTEYLTQKAAAKSGYEPSSSYPDDLEVTEKLAEVVGDDAIEKAYFDGDTAGLQSALDKKKGVGTYNKLVSEMNKTPPNYSDAKGLL